MIGVHRWRVAGLGMLWIGAALLSACGSSSSPSVASLGGSGSATQSSRGGAMHAVGQCIREHGIPGFADPVADSQGRAYYDSRSIADAPPAVAAAAVHACQTLMAQAGVDASADEPPAPPQLVQAGVKSAQCLRAHGLPNVRDPTSASPYTPGHGFGLSVADFGGSAPAGGKANPAVQAAFQACRSELDVEIRASTLSSLSHD